ncbi:uncharacterized protein PGTG_07467 [Puccinia graminis f. sp. tritici CRL 75-36-700-3]|uniref:Photolyase/cryptochrome alpha/beta domain-containing protein n=1 Tax=Puccinia graminis f. sp. tritici (strain CRL 75-36-700-3 / race SCCL) TaxID=418459 RepID=E3KD10_PUCGT|nr:uncharacterized protein PGTG_07467 [Puccinia graminis f. sp. tritici CRL 75-36-700-3]EFP82070.1 hypothetical protein PGTG_07467 [Puccinia graminis f. sp. tritici CRL 75-36-700-3]
MSSKLSKLLYWFWTDLHVHDSPALIKALELGRVELYPVWCWDPYYIYNTPVGPNRWQFLFQPRDPSIIKAAKDSDVEILTSPGHTLYPQEKVMAAAKGNLPADDPLPLEFLEKWKRAWTDRLATEKDINSNNSLSTFEVWNTTLQVILWMTETIGKGNPKNQSIEFSNQTPTYSTKSKVFSLKFHAHQQGLINLKVTMEERVAKKAEKLIHGHPFPQCDSWPPFLSSRYVQGYGAFRLWEESCNDLWYLRS